MLVLDLSKVWPERGYKEGDYHAVCTHTCQHNASTDQYELLQDGKLLNSWGDIDNHIPISDALKGLHSRYQVKLQSLTYNSYKDDDIPIIWNGEFNIHNPQHREKAKDYGIEDIEEKWKVVCKEFQVFEN